MRHHFYHSAALLALLATSPSIAAAESAAIRTYRIPAQDLASALRAFAATSDREFVAATALVEGKRSNAVNGSFAPEDALRHLLAGTDLDYALVGSAFVIRPLSAAAPDGAVLSSGSDIVVTGSRIRGAPIASPVITVGQQRIRNEGQTSLGDVVRSIPQSFGGGQNPGVGGNVPSTSGVDVGGGSSVNLRGLGSDATLTLLNGHRLSYSASRQSVDISAIPIAAMERIEVIPDGASALYGSDAVAGVANVILRRDYSGLETSASLGSATDGGFFQQSYGALTGARWRSGGLMAAYEHGSNSRIVSEQRSYAATRRPGLTIYPELGHDSGVVNGHQSFGAVELTLDALYNHRTRDTRFPLNAAGDLAVSAGRISGTNTSFAIAPAARVDLGGDWRAALSGVYGREKTDFAAVINFGGTQVPGGAGVYRNTAKSIEAGVDGPLFALPGGPAKIALGAGFRTIDFSIFRGATDYSNVARSQDDYFSYGELSLPLVAPAQELGWARRLNLSAALRYENYPGVDHVVTPKLGLIYAPIDGVTLKGSWGRSFRAPTLLQQYDPPSALLLRATSAGGSGLPAAATVLVFQGGNAALKPERASTWSVSLDLVPAFLPGARLELGYFSTRYRDRIVTPIPATAIALSNPAYAAYVTRNPTPAQVTGLIDSAAMFFNSAGAPLDPANVAALVDNSSVNAGRQRLEGVDALLSYETALDDSGDRVSATLNAAYLHSSQQLTPSQPVIPLAGTIFNPPHLRLRGALSWIAGPVAVTGVVQRIGAVRDTRFVPVARLPGMTTADLTLVVRTGTDAGLLSGVDLTLSVQNAFNAKPSPIRTTVFTDTPYDSTNYSPIGRFLSLGVRKKW
jgi:outer membrane receptor protein involved in Fe transport